MFYVLFTKPSLSPNCDYGMKLYLLRSWYLCFQSPGIYYYYFGASLVAQTVINLPAMRETWVWSLGWEDLLDKGMETHSRILAWKIQWTEEPCELHTLGSQRVIHNWATNTFFFFFIFLRLEKNTKLDKYKWY